MKTSASNIPPRSITLTASIWKSTSHRTAGDSNTNKRIKKVKERQNYPDADDIDLLESFAVHSHSM